MNILRLRDKGQVRVPYSSKNDSPVREQKLDSDWPVFQANGKILGA